MILQSKHTDLTSGAHQITSVDFSAIRRGRRPCSVGVRLRVCSRSRLTSASKLLHTLLITCFENKNHDKWWASSSVFWPPAPSPTTITGGKLITGWSSFHFKNTDYWDHSVTTAFHSIIPSLSQNYACLSYFLTGGSHTQARHIWLVGIYLFSIMHNNIPVVCQVLFSEASWVKKNQMSMLIFLPVSGCLFTLWNCSKFW